LYTHFASKHGAFRSYLRVIPAGIGLGIVAATVSAPVIVYLFGGITGAGPSVITGFLLSTGHTLIKAVFLSGFACEPVDKTLQCVFAIWLLRGLPPRLVSRITSSDSHIGFNTRR
jgi:energy-coupling factor transport system substrate-specific component